MDWRDRVLKLMKDRGYRTRNDLCLNAGISAGSLNMALNGTHELKLSTMGKLANALDTTTRWLLYGDDMVEAIQVPLLASEQITAFLMTEQDPKDCRKVQITNELKIKNTAFAWKSHQDDMSPAFENGDVLIIDKVCSENVPSYQALFVMAVSGFYEIGVRDMFECLKGSEITFYISKMVNLSSVYHFQSMHPGCPPKPFTFPTEKSKGEFNLLLGRIVHMTRTFVED